MGATRIQFRRATPAYSLDWHPAPRRQLVVTLAGEGEIELEGGRTLRFGPGHILRNAPREAEDSYPAQ